MTTILLSSPLFGHEALVAAYTAHFSGMPGIISVGLGQDAAGGPIIRVQVNAAVYNPSLIPYAFGDVPVEVKYGSPAQPLHAPHAFKARPLQPGVSCRAAHRASTGTLGGLVERGGKTYLVSNNHVLAGNDPVAVGQAVYQPGTSGNASVDEVVGTVTHFHPFDPAPGVLNRRDIAVAEVILPGPVEFRPVHLAVKPTGVFRIPAIGDRVTKCGYTSSLTSGLVLGTEDLVSLGVSGLILEFSGCIHVSAPVSGSGPFSQGGDSGAWAYDDNMNMAGMLFSASSDGSAWLINPLEVKTYLDEQLGVEQGSSSGTLAGVVALFALGLTVLGSKR